MDWFTRLVLRLLGWKPSLGRDAGGEEYEGWVRKSKKGCAYFHVYHEKKHGGWDQVIRPKEKIKPKKKS